MDRTPIAISETFGMSSPKGLVSGIPVELPSYAVEPT